MKKQIKALVVTVVATLLAAFNAQATLYNGNGNNGFAAGIGSSTLNITDNGTTINFTLSNGGGIAFSGNDALVFYLDTVTGGLGNTGTLSDTADELRRAITHVDPSSLVVFPTGFTADKAIALKPYGMGNGHAGLWDLTGSPSNLPYISNASPNLNPETAGATSYTWSFSLANLGVTPGGSFNFVGIYLNASNGFLSNEGYGAGLGMSNPGFGTATFTGALTYTTVPEPSTYALIIGGIALLIVIARRRAAQNL